MTLPTLDGVTLLSWRRGTERGGREGVEETGEEERGGREVAEEKMEEEEEEEEEMRVEASRRSLS